MLKINLTTSLLKELRQAQPQLQTQTYFKSSLIALCHAMEDQALVIEEGILVIASFQRERFFRQETHRYREIAKQTEQLYVLTALESDFNTDSEPYQIVPFELHDSLSQEWDLVVIGHNYASCLLCQEQEGSPSLEAETQPDSLDQARRFEGFWSFDRELSCMAAELLLRRILAYRPELTPKVKQALNQLNPQESLNLHEININSLTFCLVNYLQTSQYKLLKAYNLTIAQERKERLLNVINTTIRRSHTLDQVFNITVQEVGKTFSSCRCLIYPYKSTDPNITVKHEFLNSNQSVGSLIGKDLPWQKNNPLLTQLLQQESIYIEDIQADLRLATSSLLQAWIQEAEIITWLLVPIVFQKSFLGVIELHYCQPESLNVLDDEIVSLVEVIATLVSIPLIQAQLNI